MPGRFTTPIGACIALILFAGCGGGAASSSPDPSDAPTGTAEWFVERAHETGLDFVHFNGMSGEFYITENLSPGAALFDYDNDGDLDVYLTQGRMLGPGKTLDQALVPPQGSQPLQGRLYRNDLKVGADGQRVLRFTDVTDESRIDGREYGMGAATGDYDNDGCTDLYLTNYGRNQLFRNNCDGTFADVSKRSRTDDDGWSVAASFVDYDRDGLLDLFVGHYVEYSIETKPNCLGQSGEEDYCYHRTYPAQPSRLYHNNGNGTFSDVTAKVLLNIEFGPVLGVSTADFNGDGWVDIFIANDSAENHLSINQRNGTFKNTGLTAGVALTVDGTAEASMGVDAGDFDNDGDEDLFITELSSQGHNLYVNDGSGTFEDRSLRSGLGPLSLPYTGFGTAWFDFDNDGWLDILTVNGTIRAIEAQRRANDPFPLRQRKQLFRNLRDGRFEDVSDRAGALFQQADVGRGAAFGDIDNDGDTDVVVGNGNGRAQLLINQVGSQKHWLGLRLIGERGRDMVGARVGVTRRDGSTVWRRARADGTYASANDPRVLVGLGDSIDVARIEVRWPGGRVETWDDVAIDRYTTLEEGNAR